jgi:transcriptional antiterminator NusG
MNTTETKEKNWYVVRVSNNREKTVKQKIEFEIDKAGLNGDLTQIVLPMEKVYTVKDGKKIMREKPLFSGYIIIESSLNGEVKHVIKSINGVTGFITDRTGEPTPMSKGEVNRLIGVIDESSSDSVKEEPFIVGESIVITDGPFANFKGTIEEVNKNSKVKVNVLIFGRTTSVDLNANQIDKNREI